MFRIGTNNAWQVRCSEINYLELYSSGYGSTGFKTSIRFEATDIYLSKVKKF